jgi:hypothetical protein
MKNSFHSAMPDFARRLARIIALVAALAVSGGWALSADGGMLIPREVFIGDTAELSFTTGAFSAVLHDGTLFALPAEDLPKSDDVDVKSILVSQRGSTAAVTVRFVPWASGAVRLPSFKLKGVAVTPPVVRIGSLLEKTGKTTIEPPRSPLLVPGTTWMLYGLIAAILAAAVVGIIAAVKLARYFLLSPLRRQTGRRSAILLRDLKSLERKAGKIPVQSWYASFALSVRRYFGAYCDGDFGSLLSSTGTEIARRLRDLDSGLANRAASLFSDMDEIRFGRSPVAAAHAATAADSVTADALTVSAFASRELADLESMRVLLADLETSAAEREALSREAAQKEDVHARV